MGGNLIERSAETGYGGLASRNCSSVVRGRAWRRETPRRAFIRYFLALTFFWRPLPVLWPNRHERHAWTIASFPRKNRRTKWRSPRGFAP